MSPSSDRWWDGINSVVIQAWGDMEDFYLLLASNGEQEYLPRLECECESSWYDMTSSPIVRVIPRLCKPSYLIDSGVTDEG